VPWWSLGTRGCPSMIHPDVPPGLGLALPLLPGRCRVFLLPDDVSSVDVRPPPRASAVTRPRAPNPTPLSPIKRPVPFLMTVAPAVGSRGPSQATARRGACRGPRHPPPLGRNGFSLAHAEGTMGPRYPRDALGCRACHRYEESPAEGVATPPPGRRRPRRVERVPGTGRRPGAPRRVLGRAAPPVPRAGGRLAPDVLDHRRSACGLYIQSIYLTITIPARSSARGTPSSGSHHVFATYTPPTPRVPVNAAL